MLVRILQENLPKVWLIAIKIAYKLETTGVPIL
ncbi:MAG: hypothetical protein ETSY2_21655 [Candidatus Entotheonella gemina]|uniref:Uncharacterized protein n=1 Tax=Candidatus Entotheonella gemina TaxID=1429439 RepID=W4M6V2_9BACT|nr:MAG: hypothetical protein ETSY2_21655 [Candidatus Entotheonella gemina]